MRMSTKESALFATGGGLLLVALFAPPLAQPGQYHAFADQRTLWGLPHGLDVLSNLPFAAAGAAGLWLLRRAGATLPRGQSACAALFFAGLLLTAAGSAWYHLQPDDLGLAIDRGGMAIAFAGLVGLLAAAQVSERAGVPAALAMLLAGPLAIATWLASGNLLPWALVQAGGVLLIVLFGSGPAGAGGLQVRWWLVLLAYLAAKGFEAADHALFEASGQLLAGHTMKHLVAALAAWPVLAAVAALAPVQNAASSAAPVRA